MLPVVSIPLVAVYRLGKLTSAYSDGWFGEAARVSASMPMAAGSLQAGGSVDQLADQVGVTVVPRVLVDHVGVQPAQVHGDRLVPEPVIQ